MGSFTINEMESKTPAVWRSETGEKIRGERRGEEERRNRSGMKVTMTNIKGKKVYANVYFP